MSPTPVPPGEDLAELHVDERDHAAEGVKLSWPELTEPVEVPVVDAANNPDENGAEADLLALHVPAGLIGRQRLIHPPPGQLRVAVLLEQPAMRAAVSHRTPMTASTVRPWRLLPTISP